MSPDRPRPGGSLFSSKRPGAEIVWPKGKKFAFTVFDDTDGATVQNTGPVYDLLADLGFRTTKSVWLFDVPGADEAGQSCENPEYLKWIKDLAGKGFEIGYHMAACRSSKRAGSQEALGRFFRLFGHDPVIAANHMDCRENMYWGKARLNGTARLAYLARTFFSHSPVFTGHVENDPYFWGDLCRKKILFYRNLAFGDINTLAACPYMPYHDPKMPWVRYWFASSEGGSLPGFLKTVSEKNQEALENQGGACIMYTHFSRGFCRNGKIHPEFRRVMENLARRDGWFVPAGQLMQFLLEKKGPHVLTPLEREKMEWKWLMHKFKVGQT